MSKHKFLIDCYGRHHGDQNIDLVTGEAFDFIYDSVRKGQNEFELGLFLNQAALSGPLYKYPKKRRICLLSESPANIVYQYIEAIRRNFTIVFTHNKELLEKGPPFTQLELGTTWLGNSAAEWTFDKKNKLVSFIGSIQHGDDHGYSLRKDVANRCIEDNKTDCFGKGIHEIDSKITGLADYAFSIAMENVQSDYYFSEKLIDCFLAETIPIYWGCPSMGEFFDPKGMITFSSLEELNNILANLDMDMYYRMRPFVLKNKEIAIKRKWSSLADMYYRAAEEIVNHIPVASLSSMKPRPGIYKALQLIWPAL